MIRLSSVASGVASLLASALVLSATLAPVPAAAQSHKRVAAVSGGMLTGLSSQRSVALL